MSIPKNRLTPPPHTTRRERWGLGLLALAGLFAYQLVLVGPLAAVLLLNPWVTAYGMVPAVIGLLVIWWSLQPWHHTPGELLSRDEAPRLHAAADEIAAGLGTGRIHEVRLTDDFNAGALEAPVRWQPWRRRRVLLIGMPMLALVDVPTLRGVLAHELGHFSRRHGRLGHWVYRARAAWLSYAGLPRDDLSAWERGAAAFARWFAPRFSRLSFGYSRRCEFEADADGAAMVGPDAMAAALITVLTRGERQATALREGLPRRMAEQASPPAAWLTELQQVVGDRSTAPAEWAALSGKVSRPDDTHPSLRERVAALGVAGEVLVAGLPVPGPCAGSEWLPGWAAWRARFDAEWARVRSSAWRREHILRRHQADRLAALRATANTSLERGRLELAFGEVAVVLELARAWPADSAEGAYLDGLARLKSGDASGIGELEAAIARDPAWAAAARQAIADHADWLDGEAARERNGKLLDVAWSRQAAVRGQVHRALSRGDVTPARLDVAARAVLHEVLSGMPVVAAAWCVSSDVEFTGRRYATVALMLRLRTSVLADTGLSEDDVRDETMALLAGVLPGRAVAHVWTAYTTEGLPPDLDARLNALVSDPACLVRPAVGEAVGPAVRASALG